MPNLPTTTEGDHTKFLAFTRRILRAYGRRVATADPADLAELVGVRDEVDAAIQAAVDGLVESGFSWAQIGEGLGITRQAAHKRFSVNR